jgi:hypothetical protein
MLRSIFTFFAIILTNSLIHAQLLTSEPVFPTADDEITIVYDASLGNANLMGVIPVYAHTGVITNLSESPADWRHVNGDWGTADADVVMQPLGNNQHSITFTPNEFYELEEGEEILSLAFVFRNVTGSLVGRNEDGSDIYFDLYDGSFASGFFLPEVNSQLVDQGEEIEFLVQSSMNATLTLTINGEVMASEEGMTLSFTEEAGDFGEYEVIYTADNGLEIQTDTVSYIVQAPTTLQNPPLGTEDGINYLSASTVLLQLFAPGKDFVYVLGDFNGWQYDLDYQMTQSLDGNRFWLLIDGLTPGEEYRFQYYVDEEAMKIADPYSDKILDYWNDPYIPEETYPDLIEYPVGFTSEPVSVLQTNQEPFEWSDQAYQRPAKEKLIVYELLLRDFLEIPNWQSLTDTLDYLDELGINAIELMPVNEFEGNISWGYNPSFFFAPDKYYGTKDAYKAFIDECHNRGIAVIMDIALNHSFGQNPQVRMWFDPEVDPYGEPTSDNPFFNQQARHDFNVGYDYNHESPHTRAFTKRVLEYWVNEFHIDGYRMDLSKGFTQNYTVGNIGAWGAYDQSRVDILSDYANHLFNIDEDIFFILEHFADNNEETVLSANGMMPWGNIHGSYQEAAMGYSSNPSWVSYQERGWSSPNLVGYAESHDEERLMYSCLNFGNSSGDYSTNDLATALERKELVHTFLISVPGPKMLWQFGELGYDYSLNYCSSNGTINENCRTDPKPVRWDYVEMENRLKVYKVYKALHRLKTDYPTFSTTDFNIDLGGYGKRIHLNNSDMNAVIIGNFNVTGIEIVPGFQHTGTWYNYFTGEAIVENDLNNSFFLEPGEYRIYTDQPLPTPDLSTSVDEVMEFFGERILAQPNPFKDETRIYFDSQSGGKANVRITDIQGKLIRSYVNFSTAPGTNEFVWDGIDENSNRVDRGLYLITLQTGRNTWNVKVIKD